MYKRQRRIKAENAIIPNDGARRVTVIHHAQNLNPMAQNALLKELEEPPAYAFFILTAEQPDALLQTVRSRCTKFALEPPQEVVSGEEAAALLGPYLAAVAARREDRMMLAALALEKPPRRTLLGMLGVLQAALRDAVFAAEGLPQAPDVYKRQAQARTSRLSRSHARARRKRRMCPLKRKPRRRKPLNKVLYLGQTERSALFFCLMR